MTLFHITQTLLHFIMYMTFEGTNMLFIIRYFRCEAFCVLEKHTQGVREKLIKEWKRNVKNKPANELVCHMGKL